MKKVMPIFFFVVGGGGGGGGGGGNKVYYGRCAKGEYPLKTLKR